MKGGHMPTINKKYKDRLFSFLFGSETNREWTLSLYNGVNGTNYENPEDIYFTTIENAVYMGMKNDISFILFYVMNIYEQQSTYNPNMPVRQLMYAGKLYDKYIQMNNLNIYGKTMVRLPLPKLVTFYNGTEGEEDKILCLSDAFECDGEAMEPDIEVKTRMININYGHNTKLMKACRPLAEYAWFVEQIRGNRINGMEIGEAVDKAINDMPADYQIRMFLMGNRAEVKDMCITEYNEAETMKMLREEGREEGRKEGREEGEDKLGRLVSLLILKGRNEDVQKAATDKAVRANLYKEFKIL
jgi:hypothetical protein